MTALPALLAVLALLPGAKKAHAAAAKPAQPAHSFVAVVDPGHGGEQDGAYSPAGDREKDVVLKIHLPKSEEAKPKSVDVKVG